MKWPMVNAAGRLMGAMGLSNLPNYLQTRSGMPGKRPRGGGSTKFAKRRKTNRARASKLNRYRSRTKTRTKRKRSKIRRAIAQFPKDLNKEKCFITLGRQMTPPKATGFLQLVDTWTKVMSSQMGYQAVYNLREYFNKSQLIGFDNSITNTDDKWYWVPYSVVVNQFATGSKTFTGDGTYLQGNEPVAKNEFYARKDWNVFATTMDLMTTITSLVNVNQNVKILWCTPKVSTDINPIDLWDKCIEDTQKNLVSLPNDNSNIKSAVTMKGSLRKDLPFQDPRAHKNWNKSWNCVKVHKFTLAPGDHHEIKVNLKLNKMINMRFLDEWAGKYKPGVTLYPIIIVQGAPVLAVEEGAADGGGNRPFIAEKMVYSKTKVGVNMSAKIHFKELPSNQWNSARIQNQENYGNIQSTVEGGRMVFRLINDIEQVEEVTTAEQPPVEN